MFSKKSQNTNIQNITPTFAQKKLSNAIKFALLAPVLAGANAYAQVPVVDTLGANVTVGTVGNTTTVAQTQDVVFVDWVDFSVGSAHTVEFTMTGSQTALNFVTGANVSNIEGTVTASGNVYLFNNNGIVFGGSSIVNIGQLGMFSTLTVDRATFVAGFNAQDTDILLTDGDTAGDISIASGADLDFGNVDFIGKEFANEGNIASLGRLSIYSTNRATVQLTGSGFEIEVAPGDELGTSAGTTTLVDIGGTVTATAGIIVNAQAASDFAGLAVNYAGVDVADTVAINTSGDIVFGTVSNTGDATVVAGGDITQTGAITSGAAQFTASGGSITLENAGNNFTSFGATADTVSVVDSAGLALTASNATTSFTATAATGDITQSAGVVESALVDLTATTGDVTASTTAGTLDASGTNINITETDGLILGAISPTTTNLTVNAGGDITQSSAIEAATAQFTATGNTITLTDVGNNFGTFGATAATVSVVDSAGLALTASNATTSFTGTATTGDITQTGSITAGAGQFTASGNTITLENAGNNFASFGATADTVSVVDSAGLALTASNATTSFTATVATGDITQSAGVVESALVDLTATTGDVTASTTAGTLDASGTNINITETDGLILGAISPTTTNLTVNAGGDITQSSAIEAATAQFTATGNTITLTEAANNFGTFGATAATVSVVDSAGLALTASNATTSFTATAATGDITQSAGVVESALVDLTATTGDVTASTTAGTLDASGTNINITETDGLILGAISPTTTNLTVNAGGDITQSSAIEAATAQFTATGNTITLTEAANNFGTFGATAATVSVVDSAGLALTASNATTSFTATAATGDITQSAGVVESALVDLTATAGDVTASTTAGTLDASGTNINITETDGLILGAISPTTTNLTVNAGGDITQSSAIEAATAQFTASGNAITLTDAGNNFGTFGATADTVSVVDSAGLALTASNATTSFTGTATTGDITQTGSITTGAGQFTAAGNITLADAGNNFGTFGATAATVSVVDSAGLALTASNATTSFTATAATGDITQSAGVVESALVDLTATAGDVTASTTAGTLDASGTNINITETDGLILGAISPTTTNLTVNAGGDITQSSAIEAATAQFTATGNTITLTEAANNFGTFGATAATVSVVDSAGLALTASNATTSFTATAATGDITQSAGVVESALVDLTATAGDVTASTTAGTLDASGTNINITETDGLILGAISPTTTNLTVNAGGDITQSSAIEAATAQFTASGNAITLTDAGNNFGTFGATADTVSVVDSAGLALTASNATTSFTGTATTGDITQTGSITTGAGQFTAAGNITLADAGNNFGTFGATAATVSVVDSAGLALTASNATTSFTATAATGDITQSAGVVESALVDLTATTGDVTASTTAGTLNATGANIDITETDALVLGTISPTTTNLTVNAGGNITQSSAIEAATAQFTASGNAITLTDAGNNFGTFGATADTVSVVDSAGLALTASNATTSFTGTATTGDITQTGSITTGAGQFTAAGNITLADAGNNFGTVAVTATNVDIADSNGIEFLDSVGTTSFEATVASGNITTATAATISSSDVTLTATTGNVDVSTIATTFNATGGDITVNNSGALTLGTIGADTANLTVTASGDVTQTAAITVSGATNVDAATFNVDLSNSGNNFNTITTDASVVNIGDVDGIMLSGLNGSTSVEVTAGGAISGSLAAPTATLSAVGSSIDVQSNVDAITASATTTTITNTGNLAINGIGNATTDLTVTATGDITQNAALSVSGDAVFDSGVDDIVLGDVTNSFGTFAAVGDTITAVTDQDLTLGNVTATTRFNGTSVNGDITQPSGLLTAPVSVLTADNGSIDINSAGGSVIIDAQDVTINSDAAIELPATIALNLTVTAGGDITQSGALEVAEVASFNAGTNDIVLLDTGNLFGTFTALAGNISVFNSIGLMLGNINADSLTVTAGGSVEQVSNTLLDVTNVEVFATLSDMFYDIDLSNTGNTFTTFESTGADIIAQTAGALALGATEASSLDINAGGDITQTGALTVGGVSTFDAQGDITLALANSLSDTVTTSGTDVSIVNSVATTLGNTSATNLSVQAGGDITQAVDTNIASADASFSAADNAVTIANATNDFGTVDATGSAISIADANQVILGDVSANTTVMVTAADGSITQATGGTVSGTTATFTASEAVNVNASLAAVNADATSLTITNDEALELGEIDVNAIDVTADGAITQTAAITVSGASSFNAGDANSVTLALENDFSNITLTASDATIVDSTGIVLAAIDVDNLSLTSGGNVTQTAAAAVTNTATINAAGSNVDLSNAGNDFATVASSGANLTLTDSNALTLGTTTATGTLVVDAGGAIAQSGALTITGDSTFTTDPLSNITLQNAANAFASSVTATGAVVSLTNANGLDLGAVNASNLVVVAGGDVSQSGAAIVTGNSTLTATGNNIDLSNAGNNFGSVRASGVDITITDTNAVMLDIITATNLTVNSNGDITQVADAQVASAPSTSNASQIVGVTITGTSTFNAGDNNIVLTDASNDFNSVVASGNEVSITDINALSLGLIEAGSLNVATGGAITQTASATVTGNTFISAEGSAITLDNADNNFDTIALSGTAVEVNDNDALILASTDADSLTVTTDGELSQVEGASLEVSGSTSLTTNGNAVTLANETNDFGNLAVDSGSLSIRDANDIGLDNIVAASIDLSAVGDISQSAGATLNGTAVQLSGQNISVNTLTASEALSLAAINNINIGDITATTANIEAGVDVTQAANTSLQANTVNVKGTKVDLSNVTASEFNVTSGSTIAINSINLTDSANPTPLTLVAFGETGLAVSNGVQETIIVNSFTGAPSQVNLAVANSNASPNIQGLDVNTQINSFFTEQLDFTAVDGFIDPTNVDTLSAGSIITRAARNAGETAQSAANSTTDVVVVEGDVIDSNATIFRTPEPSIKLPEDQEEADEFSAVTVVEAAAAGGK